MKDCCLKFIGLAERRHAKRLEALVALYDRIENVPGDVVELGVGSGESLRCWVHMVVEHGGLWRRIWGYDTFAGFPKFAPEDGPLDPSLGKRVGGEPECLPRPATKSEVEASLPAGGDVLLVEGDIMSTLRLRGPRAPIALVFCDADTYGPTKTALDVLWSRLAPGGLMVFDEYGLATWPGETRAVDDFLHANHRRGLVLERLGMESGPAACIVKGSK